MNTADVMLRTTACVLAVCAVLMLPACRSVKTSPVPLGPSVCADGTMAETPEGNFGLSVWNHCRQTPEVDILVCVDGRTAVNHRFSLGGGHNWHTFVFDLAPGPHVLRAYSTKGQAHLECAFTLDGNKRWASLDYWQSPGGKSGTPPAERRFAFDITDQPMGFL